MALAMAVQSSALKARLEQKAEFLLYNTGIQTESGERIAGRRKVTVVKTLGVWGPLF
jgi:hypothetical protein